MEFEGEYLDGERNGEGKEYKRSDILLFEGTYIKGKKKDKEKNIIIIKNYYLKVIIQMVKEMAKGKNIMQMKKVKLNLMVNILMILK